MRLDRNGTVMCPSEVGPVANGLFLEIALLPNDSDASVLARRDGAERDEESENGADGAFRNNAKF